MLGVHEDDDDDDDVDDVNVMHCQGKKLAVDCETSEGYVTEEDDTTDTEQLKKAGKRVSTVNYTCLLMSVYY